MSAKEATKLGASFLDMDAQTSGPNGKEKDNALHCLEVIYTMTTNLPKTLDLLIFSIYSLNFSLVF